MTSDIPCIKNKCLKYPACKSKTIIVCDVMYKYKEVKTDSSGSFKETETWHEILEVLPNALQFFEEKPPPNIMLLAKQAANTINKIFNKRKDRDEKK